MLLNLVQLGRARGEDHGDYKYESYEEEHGRIHVNTHTAFFEKTLSSALTARGAFVYDGISGATPTGGPPPAGSNQVPLTHMEDVRWAGYLETSVQWGMQTTTPQVAYSTENDYQSIGISLNHAIDLNQKNTRINLGAAHNFDTVSPKFWNHAESKDTTDFLVGGSQVLGRGTLLSANVIVGAESGYLADPYRGFRFTDYPVETALFPEERPGHKNRQVFLVSLNQHIDALDGSAEVAYRFNHDSYRIFGHTVSFEWLQNLGKDVVVAPLFRYYHQSAASFYATQLPGDPSNPFLTIPIPDYYSADYRLSQMQTFTYGLSASVLVAHRVRLDAAYRRYEMHGLDGVTSASAYPTANVFTVGARLWF